ncbi:MAG: hypothetical protein ACTS7D_01815 [Candidatus Hodgkinia cicadicola]
MLVSLSVNTIGNVNCGRQVWKAAMVKLNEANFGWSLTVCLDVSHCKECVSKLGWQMLI